MPLTKVTRGALTADIIDSTKLADNAVDTEHIAADAVESAEIGENITFTGDYIDIPSCTTTERNALSAQVGMLVYNSTIGMLQQNNSSGWASIASPPIYTSVNVSNLEESDTTQTLVITGSNFDSGASAKLIDNNGTTKNPTTSTRNSSTQITIAYTGGDLLADTVAQPLDVVVTNASGLGVTAENAITIDAKPVWTTGGGSLGTVYEDLAMSAITVVATDIENTPTYSISSGALPAGVSLSSAGVISGTPNAGFSGGAVTHNFDIRADDTTGNTVDRSFTLSRVYPMGFNCLRFNDDDTAYLSRTPGSAGNRRTWTVSWWEKKAIPNNGYVYSQGTNGATNNIFIGPNASDGKLWVREITSGGGDVWGWKTDAYYRDPSAWYHFVVAVDTTQATSTDRVKVYINGVQQTLTAAGGGAPSLNLETELNNTTTGYIGAWTTSGAYKDGYLAEVYLIDGTALTPSSLGETDSTYGHWKPTAWSGTYGTNGFHLQFEDSSSIGNDSSGNDNDWTPTNLSAYDVMAGGSFDVGSGGNTFATLNGLRSNAGDTVTLSEGNLKATHPSSANILCNILVNSGKWYAEWIRESDTHSMVGISIEGLDPDVWLGSLSGQIGYYHTGTIYYNDDSSVSVDSYDIDEVIGIALDLDSSPPTVKFYNENVLVHTRNLESMFSDTHLSFACGHSNTVGIMNFGQDSSFAGNLTAQNNADSGGVGDFYYTPPTGYKALCTKNLPAPAIADPSEHFNTVLYTGNGSTNAVTGVGFSPNLVWIKERSSTSSHSVSDTVRGTTKRLNTDLTVAEETLSGVMTSFDSDGFTNGADNGVNESGQTYVAWCWNAGGAAVTNDDGSEDTSVSANTTAGFSIVKYTGTGGTATFGHGLSVAPDIVFMKNLDSDAQWMGYIGNIVSENNIVLNSSGVASTESSYTYGVFGASTFALNQNADNNASGDDFIAYCFHSVEGYSKVGSYTGNDDADGTFVYTGFRPAFVMVRRTAGENWAITDSARSPDNVADAYLRADESTAETTYSMKMDLLSNGFKFRGTDTKSNGDDDTYIYMAFAERPLKYARAR